MGHSYACRSSVMMTNRERAPCEGAAIPFRRRCRSALTVVRVWFRPSRRRRVVRDGCPYPGQKLTTILVTPERRERRKWGVTSIVVCKKHVKTAVPRVAGVGQSRCISNAITSKVSMDHVAYQTRSPRRCPWITLHIKPDHLAGDRRSPCISNPITSKVTAAHLAYQTRSP